APSAGLDSGAAPAGGAAWPAASGAAAVPEAGGVAEESEAAGAAGAGGGAAWSVLADSCFAQAVSISAATSALRASFVFIDRYPERSKSCVDETTTAHGRSAPRPGRRDANSIEIPLRLETRRRLESKATALRCAVGPRRQPRQTFTRLATGWNEVRRALFTPGRAAARSHLRSAPRGAVPALGPRAHCLRLHGAAAALRLPPSGLRGRPDLPLQGTRPLQGVGASDGRPGLVPLVRARRHGALKPPDLMRWLDFPRAVKSPYELDCLREASQLGARGHRAAERAFAAGASEFGIELAFLEGCGQREQELPYNPIIALNAGG